MKTAQKHPQEAERLASLARLKIMDTLPERDFDDLTLIASQICETPIALISLVDDTRQWFKSKQGLSAEQTPREYAFCAHAILDKELFIVSDSRKDERFSDNPLVTQNPNVIFYAGSPLLSPDGYPIGTLCVIDNKPKILSENQKASLRSLSNQISRLLDLRLQVEEQKLITEKLNHKKIAIENLAEGVVLQDENLKIIEFNSAALDVLGLTADQLLGKTSMDKDWRSIKEDGSPFPGSEHPAALALKTGEKQKDVIMGVHRPNSELRWIRINSTPIFIANQKNTSKTVTSFADVTAEKNAATLIEKNRTYLKRILDSVPAMIGHWDKDLMNLNANQRYSEYFGKTPEQIMGQSIKDLLGQEIFELNYPYMKKALEGVPQSFERAIPIPDGSIRYVLANYLPDFQEGTVVGFFVIVTDVTEIKLLEIERQNLSARMVESAKLSSLGEMAGGIAHEINTPLAIITGKAEILIDGYTSGRVTHLESIKHIEKIKLTAERIAKIIKGLRLFSRNSEGDAAEIFTISSVLEATLDLCHEKLVHAEIKVVKDIKNDFEVLGKFTELSQVIMNLVSNSIDAVKALNVKWIKIEVTQSEQLCTVTVTDSGSGISAQVQEKMMNPFFTTKEVGKGTGLGLSISSGIIKSHGGRIRYDSACANTSFVIELPILDRDKKKVRNEPI
jgi:PAS domain S-box-containing protein